MSRGRTFELRVSTAHGFPTFIEVEFATGRFAIRLRECALNELLDESLLTLPRAAHEAEFDPDLARGLTSPDSLSLVRQGAFNRVGGRLREGDLAWDSDVQERWSSFLNELHRHTLEDGVAPVVERAEGWIDGIAARAHESADGCETDEQWATLAQGIENARASLAEKTGAEPAKYLSLFPALDLADAELGQLLEAEEVIISELFHELLIDPVLERFDEAIDIDALREDARSFTPRCACSTSS